MKKILFSIFLTAFADCAFSQTQLELNQQENAKFQKADKELNEIYHKIQKEYTEDPAFIRNLTASQMTWLQFRDAEMKMKYPDSSQYGSVLPMCWSIYLTNLTQERIKTLKTWIDGIEEGDICAGSVKIK